MKVVMQEQKWKSKIDAIKALEKKKENESMMKAMKLLEET